MMVVLKVSVPSRGFGSDDLSAGRDHESGVEGFPSPLGVLGLTTDRVRWSLIGSPSFRPLSG
ncbi:Uncharacterised protein [Mycobacterium tuberculosis]|nr:Uncharacterised protein [Mycobacterium tuberculosis]CFD68977.1 Uncharacterised protein [Mycobacterium tuberculosis]CFJ89973.1 Uncharacterised protein [Mycobacterium tuberculosis]CFK28403.1 Uncharacterised protein [Mycobacterium tuberculosis]CFT41169.1 Uncharacterised protein [Mycobacterium tuberculosis]